jgi:Fur family peroxide stress response transcriptional regulator
MAAGREEYNDALDKLSERLKRMGMRPTPQRLAILEYLQGNGSHPSAEEIYKDLKPRFPSLALATVYGTLEALVKGGELRELNLDSYRKRFDSKLETHGHFVCSLCGRVYDFEIDPSLLEMLKLSEAFVVEDYSVSIYGECPDCQKVGK